MNNSVHIARAMLLIFIVSVIGSCSSTKSLFSKEYLMTHNDTTVYDNVYLVDTIEIPNPRVISFGCPGDYTDYSFLADSAIVMRIIDEFQNLHTWSDCLNYKIPCSGVISRPAASTSCRSFFITSAGIHLRSTLTVRTRLRLRTMSIGA